MSKEVKVESLKKVLRQYENDIFDYTRELDKNRLGKVLTIIDGAIADETQRKAVKDMVHDSWHGNSRPYREYPQANQVAEALGFTLYEDLVAEPVNTSTPYNPYKELVKE